MSQLRRPRENPFRTYCLQRLRFRPLTCTWADLLARLQHLNYRAALVGPQGSGKSTLLHQISAHLSSRGHTLEHHQVELDMPSSNTRKQLMKTLRTLRPEHILCVDGFGLLPPRLQRRTIRACESCTGLLVTAHEETPLPTLHQHETHSDLLFDLVAELTDSSTAEGLRPLLGDLLIAHRGNIRETLLSLYDHWSMGTIA